MAGTKTSALAAIGGSSMSASTVFMLASATATANYQATPAQVLIGVQALPLAGGTITGAVVMESGAGAPLIVRSGSYILSTNTTHNMDTNTNILFSATSRLTLASGAQLTGGSVLPTVFQTDGNAVAEQVLSATSRGNLANFINNSSDGFGAIAYMVSQSSNAAAVAEVLAIGAGAISSSQSATKKMAFIEVSGFGADHQFPFGELQTGTYYGRESNGQFTRRIMYTDGAQYWFTRTTTNPYTPDPAGGEGTLSLSNLIMKLDATASQLTVTNIIGVNGTTSLGTGNAIIASGTSFAFAGATAMYPYKTGNFLAGLTYGANERLMLQQLWNSDKRHGKMQNLTASGYWDMSNESLNSTDGTYAVNTLITDTSGNGLTGTLTGLGVSIVSATRGGNAFRTNAGAGVGSVEFGDVANVNGTALTVMAWIARNSGGINLYTIPLCRATDGGSTSTGFQYLIAVVPGNDGTNPNKFVFQCSDGAAFQTFVSTTTITTTLGAWTHIAATYDGANVRLYINGALDKTTAYSTALLNVSGAKLHMGKDTPAYSSVGIADYGPAGVFARVLTAQEIAAFATNQAPSALEVGGTAAATDPYLAVYAVGTASTACSFTTASALTFGTTSPVQVLYQAGTYRLNGRVNLKFNGATFAANRTVTLKLRRTNNTAADVSNATTDIGTGIVTTVSGELSIITIPEVFYTATAGDSITIFGSINTGPTAGTVDATEASITAIRVGP